MKLLIVTQVIDTEHHILGFFHKWVEEFAQHFERVDVICFSHGASNLPEHVHVHSLGTDEGISKLRQLIRFYRHFGRVFFNERPTYVFFHMGAIFNILAAPFFLLRKRQGTTFYWWKTHGHINLEGRLALTVVDRVLTAAAASFPIESPKRAVVGHAIDTEQFHPGDEKSDTLRLLFVGRFSRTKRLEQVVAITKELVSAGIAVETRLIGTVADPVYFAGIEALIANEGLTDVVTHIPGVPQTELVGEYQAAHVLLNPSDTDGLDKVALEAMACGTVPLTANRSFEPILSPHGLFLEKGDIAGYVAKVREIATFSPEAYGALTATLRAEVIQEHALRTFPQRVFGVE